jgi:hypothetical protein
MKKFSKVLVIAVLALLSRNAQAQSAMEGSVEIAKAAQPCAVINYSNISTDLVESTLKQLYEDAKLGSGDKSKGVRSFTGVIWPAISTDKLDYYFKVDGKKNNSTVYLAASKGYTNFITKTSDSATFGRMMDFLNNLQAATIKYQLGEDIKAQEDEIKKADKSLKNSEGDGVDLQKDLEKLQKQIAENKELQAKRKGILEEANKKLAELKSRFK